jgi:hypothetical protein
MTAAASARQAGRGAFARLDARRRTPGAPSERARRLAPRWSRWEKNVDRFRNKRTSRHTCARREPDERRIAPIRPGFDREESARAPRSTLPGHRARRGRARVAERPSARVERGARARGMGAKRRKAGNPSRAPSVSEPGRTFTAEAPGGRPEASATSSPLPNPALTLAPLPTQAKDPEPDPNPPRGSARNSGQSRRRLDLPVENIGDFIGRGGARRGSEKHGVGKQSTKRAARKVGAEAQTALGLVERRAFSPASVWARATRSGDARGHWSLTDGGAPVLSQLGIINRASQGYGLGESPRRQLCARAARSRDTPRGTTRDLAQTTARAPRGRPRASPRQGSRADAGASSEGLRGRTAAARLPFWFELVVGTFPIGGT